MGVPVSSLPFEKWGHIHAHVLTADCLLLLLTVEVLIASSFEAFGGSQKQSCVHIDLLSVGVYDRRHGNSCGSPLESLFETLSFVAEFKEAGGTVVVKL